MYGSQWGTQGTDGNGDLTASGDPDGEAAYLQELMKGLGTDGELWSGVMTQYCDGVPAGSQFCPDSSTCSALSQSCPLVDLGWMQANAPVIPGHSYTLTLTDSRDSPGFPTDTRFDDVSGY